MKTIGVLGIGVLAIVMSFMALAGDVYKCKDRSGKVYYTDRGCNYSNQQIDHSYTPPEPEYKKAARLRNEELARQMRERERAYGELARQQAARSQASSDLMTRRMAICNDAMAELNSGKPMTPSQRRLLAATCSGSHSDVGDYAIPAPPRSPSPSAITNCDAGGCWDDLGNRYNKGAGSTYFPPQGGACQRIGGQMICD